MPADLFNVRTVERLSRKVKVTDKQKTAAKLWLMNLDAGKLTAERHNYIKFANGVLRDILGYPEREIEESFEKGGVEFLFTNEEEQKVVCFELKGSDQDLFSTQHRVKKEQETPIKQTWDYIGKHNLDYGVTSNFREFVLIDKNKGYSKVHRFEFTSIKSDPSKLKEFIAIFSKKNLIVDKFAEVLYKESIIEERTFTKEFYKLFHETRLMLLKEFIDSGATQERAIHYAQIFLNRLMFVLFAEDTGKLPRRLPEDMILEVLKNRLIINEHSNMVYEVIIGLYRQLDTGAKTPVEIFGFNGELFKEEIPRTFFFNDMREESYFKDVYQQSALKKSKQQGIIESNILSRVGKGISPIISNILLMASFDFTTEVNVNILGHIFEQSITDIEKLQEGETAKQKKEGIYYTPEYITDYICRNTIIPYISKNNATTTVAELINEHKDNFEVLEKKLKDLRILDPACGSGAFLIKAVDVLLEIHKALIEAKAVQGKYEKRVLGKRGQEERYLSFSKYYDEDEARKIIEDNIYGVDINEESVEITKLSLYLKIAREKKKLLDLSKNIKCGNSLIDDKEIDKKAFNWQKEFLARFESGGFDIVIGNPPYVKARANEKITERRFIEKKFKTPYKMWDLYVPFVERGLTLLKETGYFSMIIPDTIGKAEYTLPLVKMILEDYSLYQIDFFPDSYIFEDVGVKNKIIFVSPKKNMGKTRRIYHSKEISKTKELEPMEWLEAFLIESSRISFKFENTLGLGDICYISYGLRLNSDKDDKKCKFKKKDLLSESKTDRNSRPYTEGKYIERFAIKEEKFVEWDTERCPNRLVRPTFPELYSPQKLLLSRQKRLATLDSEGRICDNTIIVGVLYKDLKGVENSNIRKYLGNIGKERINLEIISKNFDLRYLLTIINSKLIAYFLNFNSKGKIDTYPDDWKKIPIKFFPLASQKPFIEKADSMLKLNKECNEKKSKFLRRISSYFGIEKYSKKLDSFWMFSFDDFQKEVYRLSKKKLSLKEQDEWEDYFNDYKEELTELQQKTDETDKAIDQMVYQLYELTPEEIKIVEEGI